MKTPLDLALADEEQPDATESVVLAQRAKGGDRAALDELLRRYQPRLHRIIRIQLGQEMRGYLESMDIVQEAFQVAYRKIPDADLRAPGAILGWLSKIAVNQIRDAYDREHAQKRDRRRERPLDAPAPGATSSASGRLEPTAGETRPDQRAERAEMRAILDEAVAELPENYQEVVLLKDYCWCSWDEILETIGRTDLHAVQQLHQRAWIKLRSAVVPRLRDA